ncbi:MAG: hypothetical protein J6Q77_02935 [Clostridia bacterium]|nr:hypothetical protein [Clostridia bacterium]
MSKKILCLLLCLVMLMPAVLTGCKAKSNEEAASDINAAASASTMTVSLYLMSEKAVTEEQEKVIEDAVNKITKSKFKTKVDIRYFTASMYYEALESAFKGAEDAKAAKKAAEQALKEAIKRGEATTSASTEQTEEETILNEYGVSELKYPAIADYQVDIFYIGGYEKLMEYNGKKWLSKLDQELSSSSKLLNDYISPVYLSTMKSAMGGTLALPTNAVFGEYTYLLLNKKALAYAEYSAEDDFTSLTCSSTQDLLAYINRFHRDEFLPVWSATGELDVLNVAYLGVDANGKYNSETFSIFGSDYNPSYTFKGKNQYYGFTNIFNNSSFRSQVNTLMGYKENGYYGTAADDGKPFAVGYVKGGPEIVDKYSDEYEVIAVGNPEFSTEDLFGNTFAIGAYTTSVSRSMEILTYLNTNADFRNLILYGIKDGDQADGVTPNYELVEHKIDDGTKDGVVYQTVRRLNENYMMDVHKTGNELIAYFLEGQVGEIDILKYQKQQLNDTKAKLVIGFHVNYGKKKTVAAEIPNMNLAVMEAARVASAEYYEKIMKCTTVLEWENLADAAKAAVSKNESFTLMMNVDYNFESLEYESKSGKFGEGCSFYYVYMAWLKGNGIYVLELS